MRSIESFRRLVFHELATTNTTEIGTAMLPLRRVTLPAPTDVSPRAQRPAPSATSHFTRRPRTESRPAPRRPRGVALACAALALLGLLAHPSPASAQTVVWTATFTPADLGCSAAVVNKNCSETSILSEDSFTYNSTDYSVTLLFLRGTGKFEFTVDTDITTATAALTLEVGSTSLVLADADVKTARNRGWDNSGVSLTAGTVKLTELDETAPHAGERHRRSAGRGHHPGVSTRTSTRPLAADRPTPPSPSPPTEPMSPSNSS